jgi:hypothetical protein
LLLEPQRTNLVLFSEQFDNAVYDAKVNITISANTSETLDPSGYYGADKITSNSTVGNHFIRQPFTVTPSTTYTSSVYIKAGNTSVFAIGDGYGINVLATFDLAAVTATNVTGFNANIQSVGNGWYRCSASMIPSGTTMGLMVYSGTTYAGTETDKYYYLFGAQVEAGAYATSYIPTLGAAVTRGVDTCSKTGISSLIGQTEGTLFLDFVWKGHFESFQQITIYGSSANRLGVYTYDVTNTLRWFVIASSSALFELNISSALVIGQRYKLAIAYKTGDLVAYINGSQTFASSAPLTFNGALNDVYFDTSTGASKFTQPISQTLLFKTRLTNAQLAELTTL